MLFHNNCVPKVNFIFLKGSLKNFSEEKILLRARVLDYDNKVISLTEMSKVKGFNCY